MWYRLSAVGVANDDLGEQAGDCAAERCAWVPESEPGCGSWKNTRESTPGIQHERPVQGHADLEELGHQSRWRAVGAAHGRPACAHDPLTAFERAATPREQP
jgi:hypothetical protein